jgi:hypothetical protein
MHETYTPGDRVTRQDDGSRSPAVPVGSMGTVLRTTARGWYVVEWDAAPGGTYVYHQTDGRLFR